ncbi:MAG: thioredoxin family protein [Chitinophagales bacterium]|nr:thioredoxin family protein [Chitinophagaceae bacterium]MCB9063898.1 thioredoxin family protein [Chitinophagales bacterium]
MKKLLSLLLILPLLISASWRTDFSKAKTDAQKEGKYILLKFSGSDWCIPCIKMEKKVFDAKVFEEYAAKHLILVNADFPQQKKNKPSKEIEQQNEMLAEQYNKQGSFPFTVLMDDKGKVLKTWKGYNDAITAELMVNQIKAIVE